jgi:UDP-GlcNAc3NAcA epimerase
MKIVTIVGARPQFVKAAVFSDALRRLNNVREVILHTGQHYDFEMSQVFWEQLGLSRVDYNLGIGSGTHGSQTGQMLAAIEAVLLAEKPDCAVVFGDTNSTLAGALCAAKLNIPIAHIEAGLRSFNRRMPEEVNRVVADHLANMLFAPSTAAVENLLSEGCDPSSVYQTGDLMYDALLRFSCIAEQQSRIGEKLGLTPQDYVLATIHRAENTDAPVKLQHIFDALQRIASFIRVVVPVHPRTRPLLKDTWKSDRLHLIEPVGYLDMLALERSASAIVTDSGGVQKEAYWWGVPCITVRDETEWIELLDLGCNRLVPTVADAICGAVQDVIQSPRRRYRTGLYGDGHAAATIAQKIVVSLSSPAARSRSVAKS